MKKYAIMSCILLSFLINFHITSFAEPKSFTEGIYKMQDLNLSPNVKYTLQNNSPNEHVFIIILDANQIVQQLIQLPPLSDKYNLIPILSGYIMIIVGNDNVILS